MPKWHWGKTHGSSSQKSWVPLQAVVALQQTLDSVHSSCFCKQAAKQECWRRFWETTEWAQSQLSFTSNTKLLFFFKLLNCIILAWGMVWVRQLNIVVTVHKKANTGMWTWISFMIVSRLSTSLLLKGHTTSCNHPTRIQWYWATSLPQYSPNG